MAEEQIIITPETKPLFDFQYIASRLGMCAVSEDHAIHPASIAEMEIVANEDAPSVNDFAVIITTHAGATIELNFEEMAAFQKWIEEAEKKQQEAIKRQEEELMRRAGQMDAATYNRIAQEAGIPIIGSDRRRRH